MGEGDEPPAALVTWHVWTDGSCQHGRAQVPKRTPGWGGWAAIVEHGSEGVVLRGRVPRTTNVRMELLAAVKGLQEVPDGAYAVLHTDCTTLVIVESWWRERRVQHYQGADRRFWVDLAAELDRVRVLLDLLERGQRDPIHRRAHTLAGAEARGGLQQMPPNAVPLDDGHQLRKHLQQQAARRALHTRDCDPSLCVDSCPTLGVYASRRKSEARRL